MMFGRAVDQNVFRYKSFGERGAQFKFADDFNGAALLPAHQRSSGRTGWV